MPDGHLTLQQGLDIQQDQIARWNGILNARARSALLREQTRQNGSELTLAIHNVPEEKQGFEVWRGTDIDCFLGNLSLRWQHE